MIKGLAAVVALMLTVIPTFAEVVPEVTFSGGYSDNLFNDSTSKNVTYTAVSPSFKIYPSAVTEISLSGAYTMYMTDAVDTVITRVPDDDPDTSYFNLSELANLSGSAGITIIPDLDESPFNLMLSASLSGTSYGDSYQAYNNWGADAEITVSYSIHPQVMARGGASAAYTDYTNSVSGGSDGVGFFGGLNMTPFGSNSVNLEGGVSLQRYTTGLDTVTTGSGRRPSSSLEGVKSDFHVAYYSARYSRPLGQRTGLNAFFTGKQFFKEADSVIYGFTIDYLSPWYSLWDGWTTGANIKNYPGKDFILESGFTYTDKQYFESADLVMEGDSITTVVQNRKDERVSAYISLQRPFKTKSGMLIRPTIQLQWVDNSSNLRLFDYSYLQVQAGLSFKF